MSKTQSNGAEQLRGVLDNVTGSIESLVITKNGVLYFKKSISKKNKIKKVFNV
jgi:hypothetical protein